MPYRSDQLDELCDPAATNLAYHPARTVAGEHSPPQLSGMFVVTQAEAAAIRAIFEQREEFAAAVELRRRFPDIVGIARHHRLTPAERCHLTERNLTERNLLT
jgi:hypothetical protein